MNRHERRKAAAEARNAGVTTMEITPLLGEVLSLNPHGLEILSQIIRSIETGERDCMTCGAPWTEDRLPILMARVMQGKKRGRVVSGQAKSRKYPPTPTKTRWRVELGTLTAQPLSEKFFDFSRIQNLRQRHADRSSDCFSQMTAKRHRAVAR